eukprot:TRINITY_DN796_c0_g1_i6.p1 TRINITY_DN796_c0_g1~~TRINITY_DN796_c0_g1_i6.p1  ORF type:complete len:394 (-),score=40.93 TRINITY_DN796_c0_g1_i6:193-1374(-)
MLSSLHSARFGQHSCSFVTRSRTHLFPCSARRAVAAMGVKDATHETKDGAFVRTDATFRNFVAEGSEFEPETDRYHLYISYACPWACRCLAVRNLKGLEDVIGLSVVHPTWQYTRPGQDEHRGWTFADPAKDEPFSNDNGYGEFPPKDCIPDTINGVRFVRDLYEMTGKDPGKYTVPVLWDKKKKTIVSNESAEIIVMLNSAFNKFAKNADLDLNPEEMQGEIASVNEWIYPCINNGVYRCGFAQSQGAYEQAFHELFDALDKVEDILSQRRYIAGDKLTLADVRLFVTLIRFDPVYEVYFKCNKKFIREYPNMREYVKELYGMAPIRESTNMYHIKTHYYTSHPKLNWYAVIPLGGEDWWKEPHKREEQVPLKAQESRRRHVSSYKLGACLQ